MIFSDRYQRILKMVTKTEKNGPFSGQFPWELTRCAAAATNLSFVSDLDRQFYAWASRNSKALEEYSRQALVWEYAWFSFYNKPRQLKVCIFFKTATQSDAGRLLEAIAFYLQNSCELPGWNRSLGCLQYYWLLVKVGDFSLGEFRLSLSF